MKTSVRIVLMTAALGLSSSSFAGQPRDAAPPANIAEVATNDMGAQSNGADRARENSAEPMHDIRHPSFGGVVCDGTTKHDIGPAIQAALNSLPLTGGEILIPASPNQCYWANPPAINWPAFTGSVTFYIQGILRTGSTIVRPKNIKTNWIGRSASTAGQFQGSGQIAEIYNQPPSGVCSGTLGTAVTSTGVQSTITPSNMNCLVSGAEIGIGETTACHISKISRNGSGIVSATLSGSCHIPPAVGVTIAGVNDPSFNGTFAGGASPQQFLTIASDYVVNTMSWNQKGASATSSGGTVTGFDEDAAESVQLNTCTSTTCTGYFYRPHAATATWYGITMGGVQPVPGRPLFSTASLIKDLQIHGELWLPADFKETIQNVSAITNVTTNLAQHTAIEIGYSSFITLDNVSTPGLSPWSIRMSQPFNASGTGSGPVYIKDSFVFNGIKMDHGATSLYLKNVVIDQPFRAYVTFDPANFWSAAQQAVDFDNVGANDLGNNNQPCMFSYLTPSASAISQVILNIKQSAQPSSCTVNDYFTGQLNIQSATNGPVSYQTNSSSPQRGIVGTLSKGQATETELRGVHAAMAPAVIPYQTLPVVTNPAGWSGSCSVTTGQQAPDGSKNAGALKVASGTGGIIVESYRVTPAVGDMILYGGWVQTPTGGQAANRPGYAFQIDNGGSSHFLFSQLYGGASSGRLANSNVWDISTGILNDWWHPVVSFASIVSADGTAGTIRLNIGCASTATMEYWQPFMIYIPASAGIPQKEVMRWREQLLHGYVPSSAAATSSSTGVYSDWPIVLPGDPTTDDQAATKHYVDSRLSTDGRRSASPAPRGVNAFATNVPSDLPVACQQLPCVVAQGSQIGLKSATDLNLVTNGAEGTYRVTSYGYVTTAGATGAVMDLCLSWNDGYTSPGNTCLVNNQSASTLSRYNYSQTLHLAAGQTIHTYNTCDRGAVCNIDWTVERLQ